MADLFIIKERLKFSLKLSVVGTILGLLSTWYFWSQLEFESDPSSFFLSAVITGALALAVIGLFLFYLAARRVVDPSKNLTDRFDSLPWWVFKIVLLVLCLVVMAVFILRLELQADSTFDLIRDSHLTELQGRITAQPTLLQQTNSKGGETLVQMAFRENHPEAVVLLLANGAELEGMDAQGRNPIVVSLENLPMLRSLLEAGLDPELSDVDGIPPIHHAITLHASEAVVVLIEAGAKIDSRDKISRTPLLRAVENDDLPLVKMLLENGAGINEYDRRGDTALHKASRRQNAESIRILLASDADPRIFNFAQMTPLHLVAIGGHDDLVGLFLELPNMTGLHGENDLTPFDQALKGRKYDTATLLIEKGADINRILANGDTMMHQAILNRDYRTARFLIRAGADVRIKNTRGETAHDIMRRKQLHGLLELVEARDNPTEGSSTNAVDVVDEV